MGTKNKNLVLIVTLAVGFICATSAEAASIRLYDGTNTLIIDDNDSNDDNSADGEISHTGAFGNFQLVFETGITQPSLGGPSSPRMELTLSATSLFSGGFLEVSFSEVGFGPSSVFASTSASGTTLGQATYSTFQSATNTLFGGTTLTPGGTQLTTDTYAYLFPVAAFTFANSAVMPTGSSPYALTQQWTIVHTAALQSTNINSSTLSVPDGGLTVSLLGFALVGVERLRRKFTA